MLSLLSNVVGSLFSGGATGLIGILFQKFFEVKNKQLDIAIQAQQQAFEIQKLGAQAAIMEKEWQARSQIASIEAQGAKDVADAGAFAEAIKATQPNLVAGQQLTGWNLHLLVLAEFFKGAIRPALTVYLCVLTTLVYYEARQLIGKEDLTTADALAIMTLVTETILYLTTTCVVFWFGTRNQQQPPMLKRPQ